MYDRFGGKAVRSIPEIISTTAGGGCATIGRAVNCGSRFCDYRTIMLFAPSPSARMLLHCTVQQKSRSFVTLLLRLTRATSEFRVRSGTERELLQPGALSTGMPPSSPLTYGGDLIEGSEPHRCWGRVLVQKFSNERMLWDKGRVRL